MDGLKIEEVLEKEGVFVNTTFGFSMYPMLRNRKDTIIIHPSKGRLKKYDIPLYKRGEKYVLHRIVEVLQESYVICGDNCENKEYGITDEDILGVLTGFYRDNRKINMNGIFYKTYVRIWVGLYPLRLFYKSTKRKVKKAIKYFIKITRKKGDE